MASSRGYLDFIMEQLSELEDVSYRAMMGEYIIYYRGKIVGGIYDDRFMEAHRFKDGTALEHDTTVAALIEAYVKKLRKEKKSDIR